MGHRTLEITIQYAEDLNKVNFISKMDVYVVVSISGGDDHSNQKTKTTVNRDDDDDVNPSWSFPMKFTVEEAALLQNRLILDFKIKCERALGDRVIGEVHVPVKDLLDFQPKSRAAAAATTNTSFVSYQVKKPSGKPKGKLTFSYRFLEESPKTTTPAVPQPLPLPPPPPAVSYPVVEPSTRFPLISQLAESQKLYPVLELEPSSSYLPISLGGYQSTPLKPAVVAAPPPVEKVYVETMTAHKGLEPTPAASEMYPPIPPPLGNLPAGGLELEWYPPPPPPPRPCCMYPPPVMQLAPDWWIVDWRYDKQYSRF